MDIKHTSIRVYIEENYPEDEREKIIEDIDKLTVYGPDKKASFKRYGDVFIFRVMSEDWLDKCLVFYDMHLPETITEAKGDL